MPAGSDAAIGGPRFAPLLSLLVAGELLVLLTSRSSEIQLLRRLPPGVMRP